MARSQKWMLLGAVLVLAIAAWTTCSGDPEPAVPEPPPPPASADTAPEQPREADGVTQPPGTTRRERERSPPDAADPDPTVTGLEVLVTDAGTPVRGARVTVMQRSAIRTRFSPDLQQPPPPVEAGHTETDGRVTFDLAEQSLVRVVASSDGRVGTSEWLRIAAADATRVEVPLDAGIPARGFVRTGSDRPVVAAEISIALVGPSIGMGMRYGTGWTATTDERGRFDLGPLPPPGVDEEFVVLVRGRGFADFDGTLTRTDLESGPTVVRVDGWVNVRGVIQWENGSPVSDVSVSLGSQSVTTEPDGSFVFLLVSERGGTLRAMGRNSRQVHVEVGPLALKDNDLGVIRVKPAARYAGRVIDERGIGIEGALVTVKIGYSTSRKAHTDADGRFELFDTIDAPHELSVLPPVGRHTEFHANLFPNLVAGETDLEIELPSVAGSIPVNLHIRAQPAATRALRVDAVLQRAAGTRPWCRRYALHVGDEEDLVLTFPGPGTYAVTVTAEGREAVRTEVEIGDREDQRIDVVLRATE